MFPFPLPPCQPPQVICGMLLVLTTSTAAVANNEVYRQLLKSSAMIVAGDRFGSGVLVDAERRLVCTNYHVVGELDQVQVVFPQHEGGKLQADRRSTLAEINHTSLAGKVVARDLRRDLVLIEVESIPTGTVEIPLAEKSVSPGEQIHSIGNPNASSAMWVYTSGTVRQVYRKHFQLKGSQQVDAEVVETQAPINQGDSGGPVVNNRNELVAIVSATSNDSSLVSVCIDVNELRLLLNGENSTIDLPVKSMLDELNLDYELKPTGEFLIDVPTDDGNSVRVEINAETQVSHRRRIRQIRAMLKSFESDVPASLLSKLMIDNGHREFGNWEVWTAKDQQHVFFRVDLERDSAIAHVKSMMHGVASITQAMRKKLATAQPSKKTKTIPKELMGTWIGNQFNSNGTKVTYAMSLNEDGSYHWNVSDGSNELLLDDRGTFDIHAQTVTFKNEQEAFSATLRFVNQNQIAYASKSLQLKMNRYVPAAAEPGLGGRWTTIIPQANGNSVGYALELKSNTLTWTVQLENRDPIIISGPYQIDGNQLTYSTNGNSFVAEISQPDNETLIYKDQANWLSLKRKSLERSTVTAP